MAYVEDGYVEDGYIGDASGSPVSFSMDGDTLTFERSPDPQSLPLSFQQGGIYSGGVEQIGRDYYVADDLIELHWPHMTAWDKDRLIVWWRDVARGVSTSFTYTDMTGATYTVRFASPSMPAISERYDDAHDVRVQLRVV